jgi:hypothetical protein
MTHICANFFISYSLFSDFILPCSLYYGARTGLDEVDGEFPRRNFAALALHFGATLDGVILS